MKKYILILLIFSNVIGFSQTDNECYGIRLTHKRTGKVYEFFTYKIVSVKQQIKRANWENVIFTSLDDGVISLSFMGMGDDNVIWSEIKKMKICEFKYIYFDGLYAKRLKTKNFHFEKFILEDEKYCDPNFWTKGINFPYPYK